MQNSSVSQPNTALNISDDGYIRLTEDTFSELDFKPLISGSYDKVGFSGYTEWVSETSPRLSVGWDWLLLEKNGVLEYKIHGFPFSNVLLLGDRKQDLPDQVNLTKLKHLVNCWAWAEKIRFNNTVSH